MLSWLFLLLPIAFLCGWFISQHNIGLVKNKHKLVKQNQKFWPISKHYFAGLNYLLNEQPDKAVDIFLKVLEVDDDIIETHFTLGNLFRRRGELDKAITIHQNLITKSNLSKEQRSLSILELSRDYISAGVLDRAEHLLLEVINQNEQLESSYYYLLQIYQQRKDWVRAIHVATQYQKASNKDLYRDISQFYCELSESARLQDDLKIAQMYLKRAIIVNKNCARASLLLGKIEQNQQNYAQAIEYYLEVEHQDINYWNQIILPLNDCYQALGKPDNWSKYLLNRIATKPDLVSLIAYEYSDNLELDFFHSNNLQVFIQAISQKPSLQGLYQLIQMSVKNAPYEISSDLQRWLKILQQMVMDKPMYRCNKCGFASRSLQWLCPSCKTWESVRPLCFA